MFTFSFITHLIDPGQFDMLLIPYFTFENVEQMVLHEL